VSRRHSLPWTFRMRTSTGCRPGGVSRERLDLGPARADRGPEDAALRVVRHRVRPGRSVQARRGRGTARYGHGRPNVAPGAVGRRTTVAGWPPRVLTLVPAAALKASNAVDTMDLIETACRTSPRTRSRGSRRTAGAAGLARGVDPASVRGAPRWPASASPGFDRDATQAGPAKTTDH
jgi:hypothetical protein